MTLCLQVNDDLFEGLLGPSTIEGKVHLYDGELLLEFHQAPVDVLHVASVEQRPFIEDVGEMAQGDSLLSGLVAKHLFNDRRCLRAAVGGESLLQKNYIGPESIKIAVPGPLKE
jgi:hypothetical protein